MNCTHERREQVWVEEEDWYSGEMVGRWEWNVQSACEDIDLHRYRCTMCGKVMYYSGAAQAYYEDGEDDGIIGWSLQNRLKK